MASGAIGSGDSLVAKKLVASTPIQGTTNGVSSVASPATAEDPKTIDTGIGKSKETEETGKKPEGETKLSDEDIQKIVDALMEKAKKEKDVENLDKSGCANKGTCCGGTTNDQAQQNTTNAQNEYNQALQNYNTAKVNKTNADNNVAKAEQELANAQNQTTQGPDGKQTVDQNAISQAQQNLQNAKSEQKEAEQKLQEAEQKLQEAKANLEAAQGNQTKVAKNINSAQKDYQSSYQAMIAEQAGAGSGFSFAC